MIFHENRLLADNSHVIYNTLFLSKIRKNVINLSSATVVISALMVTTFTRIFQQPLDMTLISRLFKSQYIRIYIDVKTGLSSINSLPASGDFCCLLIICTNSLDKD